MKGIFHSTSRLVFLLLTLTACYAFIRGVLPVDQFMLLAVSAFSFFFTKSFPDTNSETATTKLETSTIVKDTPITG